MFEKEREIWGNQGEGMENIKAGERKGEGG